MRREIHISYLMKHIRVFKALLKQGMSKAQWKTVFAKHSNKFYEKSKDLYR